MDSTEKDRLPTQMGHGMEERVVHPLEVVVAVAHTTLAAAAMAAPASSSSA
jgi:hypothetical protein